MKKELELTRRNVTPAQFLSYIRMQVRKHNMADLASDLSIERFEKGDDLNFDIVHDDKSGIIRERSVSRPYEMQTYISNRDGSKYNEICEFMFDGKDGNKTGHGYYYLLNVSFPA